MIYIGDEHQHLDEQDARALRLNTAMNHRIGIYPTAESEEASDKATSQLGWPDYAAVAFVSLFFLCALAHLFL